jgi:hypothetical protein
MPCFVRSIWIERKILKPHALISRRRSPQIAEYRYELGLRLIERALELVADVLWLRFA